MTDVAPILEKDAAGLREILVETIAASQPSRPVGLSEAEYSACRKFLSNFDTVYTFNYDPLLNWVQMHVEEKGVALTAGDGFRASQDDFDASYVVWEPNQSHEQNTRFLHAGAREASRQAGQCGSCGEAPLAVKGRSVRAGRGRIEAMHRCK